MSSGISPSLPSQIKWGTGGAFDAPTTPSPVKPEIDRSQVDPKVLKAAQGFEQMFLNQLLKVMRKTVPKSEQSLDSNATKIYRSMLDSEYAGHAARAGGIGLADQVIAYLMRARYNESQGKRRMMTLTEAKAKEGALPVEQARSTAKQDLGRVQEVQKHED